MNASLLVEPATLDGDRVEVEGEDHRHLFRARRLGPEAVIRVTDGAGRQRSATVIDVDRRRAEIELGDWLPSPRPARPLSIFVATPRAERARWLVEKLVELGVHRICFVLSERVNHPVGRQLDRLERVAKSALLQCGSARLPILEERGWKDLEPVGDEATERAFLLAPRAEHSLVEASALLDADEPVALWFGPEGGFTEREEQALLTRGARAVHLGPMVLRVETAAIVAAGVLLAR